MDQKTFHLVASARIEEFAEDVPSDLREEFVQDMWVHLLGINALKLFDEKGECAANLGGFLSLLLFRARVNWLVSQRTRARGVATDPADFDSLASTDLSPSARHDARVAVRQLLSTLTEAAFTEAEIDKVMEGLENELTLADIARSIGRSPQSFHYHVLKVREAA